MRVRSEARTTARSREPARNRRLRDGARSRRTLPSLALRLGATAGIALALAAPAQAIRFGPSEAFELRGKFYSQYTVSTEESQLYTQPEINPGDMKQWRNYMNPEFEVDFRAWSGWKLFDDLSGRLAMWGFYDGIYDFGPKRYSQVLAAYRNRQVAAATKGYTREQALDGTALQRNGRDFYGRRIRVNEAYVNLAKGPLFVRVGRQAISWGEADTIGLLDANNPFDTLIQPGFFIDLDEARIPLWTLRATYELYSTAGPFSSGYVDAYFVPGWLDTTISPLNIASASPYSSPPPAGMPSQQTFDKLPSQKTGNSRWGVRFSTMVARNYNASIWFYKTFPIAPVPTLIGLSDQGQITTIINHGLTNVIGTAVSWYSDAINSIVRTEVELFNNEPAFLAFQNIGSAVASGFQQPGTYDTVNILRGELGVDHNFFVPALNPAASFLAVTSVVFNANLDESDTKDYRANGILKPSAIERQLKGGAPAGFYNGPECDNRDLPSIPGQPRCDFVNQDPIQAFMQSTLTSEFAHGRLTPRLTTIVDFRGALAFQPSVLFRYTDNLLFDMKYVNTHTFGSINNGYVAGIGLQRDRDQVWFRATYQLN